MTEQSADLSAGRDPSGHLTQLKLTCPWHASSESRAAKRSVELRGLEMSTSLDGLTLNRGLGWLHVRNAWACWLLSRAQMTSVVDPPHHDIEAYARLKDQAREEAHRLREEALDNFFGDICGLLRRFARQAFRMVRGIVPRGLRRRADRDPKVDD